MKIKIPEGLPKRPTHVEDWRAMPSFPRDRFALRVSASGRVTVTGFSDPGIDKYPWAEQGPYRYRRGGVNYVITLNPAAHGVPQTGIIRRLKLLNPERKRSRGTGGISAWMTPEMRPQ